MSHLWASTTSFGFCHENITGGLQKSFLARMVIKFYQLGSGVCGVLISDRWG